MRGKSDPIDAHLAALLVLRMRTGRLPTPRADGNREALQIPLGARRELSTSRTRQVNRLRALPLSGNDDDRTASRGALSTSRLNRLENRPATLTLISRRSTNATAKSSLICSGLHFAHSLDWTHDASSGSSNLLAFG